MADDHPPNTTPDDDTRPLFSVVSGEGDGFMLGLAAGDTAGGASPFGYSAITQQATVISYHLIEHRRLDAQHLIGELVEMDGTQTTESVYRGESRGFRSWLDEAAGGVSRPGTDGTVETMARAAPLGATFRRDAESVIELSREMSLLFTTDGPSVAAGVIGGAGVAAAAFGQSGRDFVAGVSEAVIASMANVGEAVTGGTRLDDLERELAAAVTNVGIVDGPEALEAAGGQGGGILSLAIAGLLLAATPGSPTHKSIEEAARIGGSALAAFVGAVVGARVGIMAWPWPFSNDTWFAEIARRLVRGPNQTLDLPIPYAVEQHLMSEAPRGFH